MCIYVCVGVCECLCVRKGLGEMRHLNTPPSFFLPLLLWEKRGLSIDWVVRRDKGQNLEGEREGGQQREETFGYVNGVEARQYVKI